MTRKRAEAMTSIVVPDEEVKQAYEEVYRNITQTAPDPFNMNDALKGHCVYTALTELKERFPKERVDVLEKYLVSQHISEAKPRRRYVKVPSGKRPHFSDVANQEYVQMNPDTMISLLLCFC